MNIYAQITVSDWFFKPDRAWTAIYKLVEYNGEYYWEQSHYYLLETPVVTTLTKTCNDILKWSRPGTQFLFSEDDLAPQEDLAPQVDVAPQVTE